MTEIIEGRNPVLEALRSGRTINRILLAKGSERHGVIADILFLARDAGVRVDYVERQVIDRQSLTGANQGIIAFVAAREYTDLDDLLLIPGQKGEPAFFVILDGIEDPHNLGAVIRTADATGSHGIIIREKRAVGLTSVVEKSSAGALEYVPVAKVANISQTIETLKKNGVWIVGIDQSGSTMYTQVDFKPPTGIVIGSEGRGISDLVKKHCDFLARIPMKGKVNSLNASVAAAVVLYEVLRQRTPTIS
jgi:23S rRNA (guanosine2251-2'-O)-methyltransferase